MRFSLHIFLAFLLLNGFSCRPDKSQKLRVAVAANMALPMEKIREAYQELKPEAEIELIINSSGKLYSQIKAGAPYQIFISADTTFPHRLFKESMGQAEPQNYALGSLVLLIDGSETEPSINGLIERAKHVAMANPELAPYGKAAKESLQRLNLWESHQKKFVLGESVGQSSRFFYSGAADVSFSSQSMVRNYPYISIPDSLYSPIKQAALILKQDPNEPNHSLSFYKFLFSNQAKEILKSFGYKIPQSS
ncbi:MAG: molybdate ABC transporter substrate-binding protein [Bacteroidia bacterium]|nr:molybdate ABC transporter substrate-binding protein [Bacteroidia bacterium]